MDNKLKTLRDRLIFESNKEKKEEKKEEKKYSSNSKVTKSTSYETRGYSTSLKYKVNYSDLADELSSKKAAGKNHWTKAQARQVFSIMKKNVGLADPKKDKE